MKRSWLLSSVMFVLPLGAAPAHAKRLDITEKNAPAARAPSAAGKNQTSASDKAERAPKAPEAAGKKQVATGDKAGRAASGTAAAANRPAASDSPRRATAGAAGATKKTAATKAGSAAGVTPAAGKKVASANGTQERAAANGAHSGPGSTAAAKKPAPDTKEAKSAAAKQGDGAASAREAAGKKPASAGRTSEDARAAGAATGAKLAKQNRAKKPCFAPPVQLVRVRGEQVEPRELSLTMCSGAPNTRALDSLSVLARPRDEEAPSPAQIQAYRRRPIAKGKVPAKNKAKFRDPLFVAEGVMRVHPGLLVRLQQVADHYPGKIIEIISGYRPDARVTSRHHHARALDLRVAGVTRERLRDYLRSFEETGVGYYPNSYFVHMDVRDIKGYWVDRSGPGETADYGPWPPSQEDLDQAREQVLKGALADLNGLRVRIDPQAAAPAPAPAPRPAARSGDTRTATAQPAAQQKVQVREPEQESDDMSTEEVARVRAEARRALSRL